MQDPRFNTFALDFEDDQDFPAPDPAISKALEEWAQAVINEEREERFPSLRSLEEKDLLPSRFIAKLPEELYGIDLILSDRNRRDPLAIWLIVQALLKIGMDNCHDLATAWTMVTDSDPIFWRAADKALTKEAARRPEAWKSSMEDLARHLAEHPADIGLIGDENDSFMQMFNDWKTKTSVRGVWTCDREFSWFSYFCSASGLFAQAILLDVQFGTRQLETMGIPPMCEHVLMHQSILEDKEILLNVIRESPFVLTTENSTDWNGSIVAPMAMDFYKHHVERLHEAIRTNQRQGGKSNELPEFVEKESPELFRVAAEAILQRSDGIFLASNYLCHLVQWRDNVKDEEWSSDLEYAKAIAQVLANKTNLVDLKRALGWSPQPEEAIRKAQELGTSTGLDASPAVDDLSTVISIQEETAELEDNAPELISLFEQVLFAKNNGIHISRHSDRASVTPLHYNLAKPYACSESPAKRWAETWQLLSGVRFRSRQIPFASDETAHPRGALLTAVLVGIALYDEIAQDNPDSEESSLLKALWDAAYGMWLTLSMLHRNAWDSVLNMIIVRRGIQFSSATPPHIDAIKTMFSQLGGAKRMTALAACSLQLNVSSEIMNGIREDIAPPIQAFIESEQDIRIEQNKHPQLMEACKKFLNQKTIA